MIETLLVASSCKYLSVNRTRQTTTMIRLFFALSILLCACHAQEPSHAGWQKVYQNDSEGQTTFGEKSKLIDAVRLGYPVRIGWGSNRIEHVANADFLTIFQGEEVFGQIETIVGQAPAIEGDTLKVRFRTNNRWTKMAGTNGYTTAFMTDAEQDTLVGGGVDRAGATTWYVLYPSHQVDIEARPLWREGSPNWDTWKN